MMNFFPTVQRKNYSNLVDCIRLINLFLFRYFLAIMQATTVKTEIKVASIIVTLPGIE